MSYLRIARQQLLRPITRTTHRATFTTSTIRPAGDYGSGESAPPGQKPSENTGKNPSEHLEHPGPAPPSVAGGSKEKGSSQQSGQGKDASSQSQSSGSSNKGTQGAQPKILNESPPKDHEASEEVRQHNREVDQRAERTHDKVKSEDLEKDKVGKDFWSGQGGADKQP